MPTGIIYKKTQTKAAFVFGIAVVVNNQGTLLFEQESI